MQSPPDTSTGNLQVSASGLRWIIIAVGVTMLVAARVVPEFGEILRQATSFFLPA